MLCEGPAMPTTRRPNPAGALASRMGMAGLSLRPPWTKREGAGGETRAGRQVPGPGWQDRCRSRSASPGRPAACRGRRRGRAPGRCRSGSPGPALQRTQAGVPEVGPHPTRAGTAASGAALEAPPGSSTGSRPCPGQRLDMAICLRRGGHCQRSRLADHRDVEGLEVESSLDGIPDHSPEEAQGGTGRATLDPSGEAVEGDLGHYGDDPGVVGRDRDDVSTAERVAPQRHPVGVQVITAANPGDGGSEVLVLAGGATTWRGWPPLSRSRGSRRPGWRCRRRRTARHRDQAVHGAAEAVGEDNTRQPLVGPGLRFGKE
jgi:hypothetical protein